MRNFLTGLVAGALIAALAILAFEAIARGEARARTRTLLIERYI